MRESALCSHIHVGATTQAARSTWEPHYRTYWEFVGGLLGGAGMWPDFDLDELLAGPGICGSPEEVADKLAAWEEIFGLDRHLLMFDLGGMEHAEVAKSLELFGTDVMSAVSATNESN